MKTHKLDLLYRIVPGIMFLILMVGYFINSSDNGLSLSRLIFIGSFVLLAVASFIRRDSLPGLILLGLGLAFHTCRNALRLMDLLPTQQPVLLVVNLLLALGFGLMLLLCLAYSSGIGGAALADIWFLPAALIAVSFVILQFARGLSTSFWNFLYPIGSAAALLLLGVSASDPYFEEDEEEAPAPASTQKPLAPPVHTSAVRSSAPAQKPAAPTQKPAAPAQKSAAPTQKPTAPTQKPAAPTQKPTAPTQKPAAPTQMSTLSPAAQEDLKLYKELMELGVITQEEFEAKKNSLVGQ